MKVCVNQEDFPQIHCVLPGIHAQWLHSSKSFGLATSTHNIGWHGDYIGNILQKINK